VLRRAENVQIVFQAGWITGKGWFTVNIGRTVYRVRKIHKDEFAHGSNLQMKAPVRLLQVNERTYWQFQNRFYWDNDDLQPDQIHALLVTKQQREQRRIEQAQQIFAMGDGPRPPQQRGHIPDDVKHLVWTRDRGPCRRCGSQTELQFDHVIPVSLGGSSQPENLQILCGPSNRRKSAELMVR
jgi:hypothetical protein